LTGAHASEAYLNSANLSGANLSDAKLSGANLTDAKLTGAKLSAPHPRVNTGGFSRPPFAANLSKAALSRADLSNADLGGTKNLTQGQLDEACGNEQTKLPDGLKLKPCSTHSFSPD
jgi:uncharacterized protein YjbI with pentapeptide repeats